LPSFTPVFGTGRQRLSRRERRGAFEDSPPENQVFIVSFTSEAGTGAAVVPWPGSQYALALADRIVPRYWMDTTAMNSSNSRTRVLKDVLCIGVVSFVHK